MVALNRIAFRMQKLGGEIQGPYDAFVFLRDNGAAMDFMVRPTENCPTNCPNTVTLCGYCTGHSMPNNIIWGFVCRWLGYSWWDVVFGGDSTMAIFGAPVSLPPSESAHQAIRAAFKIRTRLAEYNARRIDLGRQMVRTGIGINTGEVITGNVGSEERFEYTVIGDTVNVASRVEGLTKELTDSSILITEAALVALEDNVRLAVVDHGAVALKGKKKLVRVYGVLGIIPEPENADDWLGLEPGPAREVLEALYVYCRGYSVSTIALTKNTTANRVEHWLELAVEDFDAAVATLRREFDLTDAELDRLRNYAGGRAKPIAIPVSYAAPPEFGMVAGHSANP